MATDRKSHRDKSLIYHLTHATNLPSIAAGGLLCRRLLVERRIGFADVADQEILAGRDGHGLDACVPFHFIHQSPFDCAVVQRARDKRFVLVAINRSTARSQNWQVVPKHPLAGGEAPEICSWEEGIGKIDWSQMDRYPRPYDEDHHCKMVCMAEALGPSTVPAGDFAAIYTPTDEVLKLVEDAFAGRNLRMSKNAQMFPGGCR